MNITLVETKVSWSSHAKNVGAKRANTDYVYFLDDDVLPSDSWNTSLVRILEYSQEFSCGGGNIISKEHFGDVPSKYLYIFGHKDLWDQDREIVNNYFWWANIFFSRKVFNQLGGFESNLWHIWATRWFNEEVYIQEKVIKLWESLHFFRGLDVAHLPIVNFSKNDIIKRLIAQWKYDVMVDKQINKQRLVLRTLKYLIYVSMRTIAKLLLSKSYPSYDYVRYSSYLQNLWLWRSRHKHHWATEDTTKK